MSQKAIYQLSARQIILLAFASAILAVGVVIFFNNISGLSNAFQTDKNKNVAYAEEPTASDKISEPSAVSGRTRIVLKCINQCRQALLLSRHAQKFRKLVWRGI